MSSERMAAERDDAAEITVAPTASAGPIRRRPASATGGGRAGLVVGAANDAFEREADRVADGVLRRLADPVEAGDPTSSPIAGNAPAGGRVRRSSTDADGADGADGAGGVIGAAGGALDAGTSAAIDRERGGGRGLPDQVRREMETGFGADFGRVRLHTGAAASRLNESMQAQAFTVGNDVFVHDRAPRPSSAGGRHLMAHELAHTLQQSGQPVDAQAGTANRRVHRLMDAKAFMKATSQSSVTRTSSKQKQLEILLDVYHFNHPVGSLDASTSPGDLAKAEKRLIEMRSVAQEWIAAHTIDTTSGVQVQDGSRAGRRVGMETFISQCDGELTMIRGLTTAAAGSTKVAAPGGTTQVTDTGSGTKKVTALETGDLTSMFSKVGYLIDAAAPLDGDAASITIEVKIPIPPGYVGFELSAAVSRDDGKVSVSANAGVTGGASVDIASIGGALGGYLKATAPTGADAAGLMSYGLFRRSRQSSLVPREVENFLWGGANAGAFGWAKAEEWSLGVERRILDTEGAEVESGAYVAAKAKVKLSAIASAEMAAKGTLGTKTDKGTLEKRKGGAGNANLRSGAAPTSTDYDTPTSRGRQKSVGVGTGGFEIGATGSFGPFSGGLKAEVGWTSNGAHGKKTVDFDGFKLSGSVTFAMPMGQMLGGAAGNMIPALVSAVNKLIRSSLSESEARSGARAAGNTIDGVAEYANMVAGLANVPATEWAPFAASTPTAGLGVTGTQKFSLSVDFDFAKKKLAISLNQSKGGSLAETVLDQAGDATDVFKLEIERTSRLLKLTYADGGWKRPT
ncbi:hypothetical protein BH23ACT3_BH23ACT3_18880 [soil metagenome]